tara:strand:+ start:239 stop:1378 length:1140 start_codon:yes stop_codon:yes gene_type:complete
MKLLTMNNFLNKFKDSPSNSQSLDEFVETANVSLSNHKVVSLSKYMKQNKIKKQDVKLLLENIENRNEYLTRFYNTSLKVDENNNKITDIEPMKKLNLDNNSNVQYKNLIRNLHYKEILQETKSGFENTPSYLDIIINLYTKNLIDYKLLTPSSIFYMKNGRLGSVFSSYYFRASILNPYLIFSIQESVLKGTKVFTPTLGWSSYLFAFLQSSYLKEYVGTDVIPSVCSKTRELGKQYEQNVKIYCKASEDLYKSKVFLKNYKKHFDLVFFSPPYFKLELYDSENQSTDRYDKLEDWLREYWENTIKLCYEVLEKNGKLCYILSGYGSHDKNNFIDLVSKMNEITKKYFSKLEIIDMHNKNVHSTKHRETGEKIMIFKK